MTPRKPELVERIHIAVEPSEKRLYKKLARSRRIPFSQWIREACREAAYLESLEAEARRGGRLGSLVESDA